VGVVTFSRAVGSASLDVDVHPIAPLPVPKRESVGAGQRPVTFPQLNQISIAVTVGRPRATGSNRNNDESPERRSTIYTVKAERVIQRGEQTCGTSIAGERVEIGVDLSPTATGTVNGTR